MFFFFKIFLLILKEILFVHHLLVFYYKNNFWIFYGMYIYFTRHFICVKSELDMIYIILMHFVATIPKFHRSVKSVKKDNVISVLTHTHTSGGKNEYSVSSITEATVLSIEDYRFVPRNRAAPKEGKEETRWWYRDEAIVACRDKEEGQRRSKWTMKNALSETWRAILAWYF